MLYGNTGMYDLNGVGGVFILLGVYTPYTTVH